MYIHPVFSSPEPKAVASPSLTSSQKRLGQFQSNLVGIMLGGWGFRFIEIKGLTPFGVLGPRKGQNKENFDKSSNIFFS